MRKVLNDDDLEKRFRKNGYVRVPFLNASQVRFLKNRFFELNRMSGGNNAPEDENYEITYDFTFIDKNIEYKKATFKCIDEVFRPVYSELLAGYTPIIANFIRKKHKAGEVPLHQNWAFVDEETCTSVSVWVPLVDSTEANGTLQVVPGSHKRFGKTRGPIVPWELEEIKEEIISNHLVPLETKAGDAVILDDSIVHYSAVNKTDDLRLAIQLILIPEEKPSIHYHMNPARSKGQIKILQVNRDFYMEFNPWKLPENEKTIGVVPFREEPLSETQFIERLQEPGFDHRPNSGFNKFLKKLKLA